MTRDLLSVLEKLFLCGLFSLRCGGGQRREDCDGIRSQLLGWASAGVNLVVGDVGWRTAYVRRPPCGIVHVNWRCADVDFPHGVDAAGDR